MGQEYQSEIISEHVILGNDVLFKCSIPSFVADFVQVDAWIDSDAESHYQSPIYGKLGLALRIRLRTASCKGLLKLSNRTPLISVVAQDYEAQILDEHVILGNAALFKCSIPSFVADFVAMEAWIDSEASSHYLNDNYGKVT